MSNLLVSNRFHYNTALFSRSLEAFCELDINGLVQFGKYNVGLTYEAIDVSWSICFVGKSQRHL